MPERGSLCKSWCYTLNNYSSPQQSQVLDEHCHYHVYGQEVGEAGTPHLQGFVVLIQRKRLSFLKDLLPTAHWEPAKGSVTQNFNYCSKDKQFVEYGERPLEKGAAGAAETRRRYAEIITLAKAGSFAEIEEKYPGDFIRYHNTIKRIKQDNPQHFPALEGCCGEWYWGTSGSGKSHYVRDKYRESLYLKPCNKWWDGYKNEDTVYLEDVDPSMGKWIGYYLKIWADKYDYPAEVKGSTINIRPIRIVVTSQYPIMDCFEDSETKTAVSRRFQQYYVSDRIVTRQSEGRAPN